LLFEDKDKDKDLSFKDQGQGQALENWFSRILKDKDFPLGQQHCLWKTNELLNSI